MKVKLFKVQSDVIKNQCYLVSDNKNGVLIDPAWNFYEIDNYLIENRITLNGIFLTHSHIDHIDLAEEFAMKYEIPVFISKPENDYYAFECHNLKTFNHLEEISLNGIKITPYVTPGHTVGSSCFLIKNNLFTGDTVFIEGVGYTWTDGGNAESLFDSIQLIKKEIPLTTKIWPGHSYGKEPGVALANVMNFNVYFDFDNKEDFINFRTRKNQKNLYNFK